MSENQTRDLDPAQTIVLNGLVDVLTGDRTVLDDESTEIVTEAYEAATSPADRGTFEDAVERLASLEPAEYGGSLEDVYGPVAAVTDELAARSVEVAVEHTLRQEFTTLDASVYSQLRAAEGDFIGDLDLSAEVANALIAGTLKLRAGVSRSGRDQFERAVSAAADRRERVASLVMAGWAHFLAGRDERALEYADEALHTDPGSWVAKLVWIAASYDQRERIRAGDLAPGVLLRWVTDVPEDASLDVRIGEPVGSEEVAWTELSGASGHAMLDRVWPVTWIRFDLRGTLPDVPVFQSYYLGMGIYDEGADEVHEVERLFETGPEGDDSVESFSFRRPE